MSLSLFRSGSAVRRSPSPALRRTRVLLATLTAALLAAVVSGPTSVAADSSYVALGDSYASGTGTRSYLNDGSSCQRSAYAYPSLIAAANGSALNFRACSGARVGDVSRQLDALSASTNQVTVSVGGNDAGFAPTLTECAKPSWMSNCNRAIDRANAYITNTLPGSLDGLYTAIRSRAAQADVVVVGYPRLFNGVDCNAFTWFSPAEQSRLNATADLLNDRIGTVARAHGFTFANPTNRFIGHAVCSSAEWVNGLSYPISESYHPNRAGHSAGFTALIGPLLTGAPVRLTQQVRAEAQRAAPAQAARQREYAAVDRGIVPERFTAPDLGSAAAKTAAAKAGVDLSSRASIDRADRVYAQRQAAAWRATQ